MGAFDQGDELARAQAPQRAQAHAGDADPARVLGDEEARTGCVEGLTSAHGVLQREVGRSLRMKRTPTLTFHVDETALRAAALEALIKENPPSDQDPGEGAA